MFISSIQLELHGRTFGMQDTIKQWPIFKPVAYVHNRCRSKNNNLPANSSRKKDFGFVELYIA